MIVHQYKLTTYTDYLARLASVFNAQVVDNQFCIPPQFGKGFFKLIQVTDELEAIIYDFTLKETFVLRRQKEPNEYYTLNFEEITNANSGFSIAIGSEKMDEIEKQVALYLTSFLYDIENVLQKDINLRGIRILLTPDWMRQYLQLDEKESVLKKYIDLKTAGVMYKPVGDELRGILKDILNKQDIPLLFYQNKILRIIERFFAWLYDEMKIISEKNGISLQDIETAQKIEALITNDITVPPPTIKEMAREAAMSESKLKKVFKTVYGLPPYEYYQKQRMHKAKLMLLSGEYSIKDVGYTLGYANLSNFTLAFKKVYNQLPSNMVRNSTK